MSNGKTGFGQMMRSAIKGLRGRGSDASGESDTAAADGAQTAQQFERQAIQLSEQGEYAQAQAACREGIALYPQHTILARIAASAAARQHAWRDAAEWSALVRASRPTDKAGYMIGIRAARVTAQQGGSDALLVELTREAETRFPKELWAGRASAQLALDKRDFAKALTVAERLQSAFPEQVDGYEMAILAMFQMRRIDEAAKLLASTQTRMSDRVELVRLGERLKHWRKYVAADEALREAAEHPRAKPSVILKYARHSDKTVREYFGHHEAVVSRLLDAQTRLPHDPAILAALSQAYTDLDQPEQAAQALQASGLIEAEPKVALAWADLATASGDLETAATRHADAVKAFPDEAAVHAGLVRALARLVERRGPEHRAAAEAAAVEAMRRFPDSEDIHDQYAWIAQHCGDHREALARWTAALEKFPDSAKSRFSFRTRVLDASLAVGEDAGPVPTDLDAAAAASPAGAALTDAELGERFQNLGSTVFGCEYGGVQRYLGVEPLHLMRWGSCPIESLIALIENDFQGFMEEGDARLDISVRPGAHDEYVIRSLGYHLRMDTFVPVNDRPLEQNLSQIRRRNLFLTRKLREELARPDPADKTLFVYKAYEEHVTDADLDRLAVALQQTGPNTLLAMRRANAEHPSGSTHWAGPHLIVGYLPEFGKTAAGVGLSTHNDVWKIILRDAHALWAARQADSAAPAAVAL